MKLRRSAFSYLSLLSLLCWLSACEGTETSIGAELQGGWNAGGASALIGGASTVAAGVSSVGGTEGLGGDFAQACGLAATCSPRADADPGTLVDAQLDEQQTSEFDALRSALDSTKDFDTPTLSQRYPATFNGQLDYDASTAVGLELLQASSLQLQTAELSTLSQRGFVISERERFPNFLYGYKTYYALDLSLFVSADSVLYAVHQSYDSLLRRIEI